MFIMWGAFLLLTLFYGIYFGKQLVLKKQGIQTARLTKGDKPAKTRKIETALLIATYGTAAIQYISLFGGEYINQFVVPPYLHVFGLLLLAAGVLFFWLATAFMRSNWRAGIDKTQNTSMVTNGIYKVSRNPAFVGFDLLYVGSFLTTPNPLMLLFALFAIVTMHLQILEEEKYLASRFGSMYLEYKAKTPRYILF